MIFNNTKVECLYKQYLNGNHSALEELCLLSSSLINIIALSVCSERFDDLVQEGYIKLVTVISEDRYDFSKNSTMYSFLSTVIRNRMIDVIRKDREHEELREDLEYDSHTIVIDSVLELDATIVYLQSRFPSLHKTVIVDAATYVLCAIMESARGKSRGIINTLELLYPLNRSRAYVFYHSIVITLKLLLQNDQISKTLLNGDLIEQHEWTLHPEIVLSIGMEHYEVLSKLLIGTYVKF